MSLFSLIHDFSEMWHGTTPVRTQITINVPIEIVWNFITDPPHFPLYMRDKTGGPSIDRRSVTTGTPAGAGVICVWEPPKRFGYGATVADPTDIMDLRSVSGGTEVTLISRSIGKPDPTVEAYYNEGLRALKRRLEHDNPQPTHQR